MQLKKQTNHLYSIEDNGSFDSLRSTLVQLQFMINQTGCCCYIYKICPRFVRPRRTNSWQPQSRLNARVKNFLQILAHRNTRGSKYKITKQPIRSVEISFICVTGYFAGYGRRVFQRRSRVQSFVNREIQKNFDANLDE